MKYTSSGELREALGRESEKPSGDKALTPAVQIPERFARLANRSGENPRNPCAPGLSPGFTSDSRDQNFFV